MSGDNCISKEAFTILNREVDILKVGDTILNEAGGMAHLAGTKLVITGKPLNYLIPTTHLLDAILKQIYSKTQLQVAGINKQVVIA